MCTEISLERQNTSLLLISIYLHVKQSRNSNWLFCPSTIILHRHWLFQNYMVDCSTRPNHDECPIGFHSGLVHTYRDRLIQFRSVLHLQCPTEASQVSFFHQGPKPERIILSFLRVRRHKFHLKCCSSFIFAESIRVPKIWYCIPSEVGRKMW